MNLVLSSTLTDSSIVSFPFASNRTASLSYGIKSALATISLHSVSGDSRYWAEVSVTERESVNISGTVV